MQIFQVWQLALILALARICVTFELPSRQVFFFDLVGPEILSNAIALNSGLYWPRRRFLRFPGKVRVEVLDPILPGLDRKAFFTELEQKLEAATARLIDEGLRELGEAGRAHYETAQSRA